MSDQPHKHFQSLSYFQDIFNHTRIRLHDIMDTKGTSFQLVEDSAIENTESAAAGLNENAHSNRDIINLECGTTLDLSTEHRDYLISRHGTSDLEPLPSMDPNDPLNWPRWKVILDFTRSCPGVLTKS